MSDLRNRLERLGDRARVAPDAFEKLDRTRRRRERNRRIAAGSVALLVAIGGSVAAYTAFRQPGGEGPAAGGTGVTAPAPAASSPVAEFTCDGTGTISPDSLTVEAQRDGVHVAFTNLADEPVSFTVGGPESSNFYRMGQEEASPGERKESVWQLAPGDTNVSCKLVSAGGIDTSPVAHLQVEDPAGLFVPFDMNCPTITETRHDVEVKVGTQGAPIQAIGLHLSGLELDDSIQQAGYPNGDPPIIRVVRDGEVVAVALFVDGHSERVQFGACPAAGIGWADEVPGVSGPSGSSGTSGPSGSSIPPNAWDQLCEAARADGPGTDHNGADLTIGGSASQFDTRCMIAPAGEPITIRLSNGDADVLRNISVYALTPYLRECIVTGTAPSQKVDNPVFEASSVGETSYRVGPLEPGEYYFQDDVHPSANGVLVVE